MDPGGSVYPGIYASCTPWWVYPTLYMPPCTPWVGSLLPYIAYRLTVGSARPAARYVPFYTFSPEVIEGRVLPGEKRTLSPQE